ncbi:hypothetical protein ACQ4PT_014978 [Festuca glaucescens]
MLREKVVSPDHRRLLLNVSTGQCIRVTLPELSGHHVFGPTTEGLLVLLHRTSYAVRLLNPLAGNATDLPLATTLLHLDRYGTWLDDDLDPTEEFDLTEEFKILATGLVDDSTFAFYFNGISMLALAKPGDACWTLVDDTRSLEDSLPISFQGRFYFPTNRGLMVVDTSANHPPLLVLAADLTKVCPQKMSTIHLVDNDGELILVYRNIRRRRFNKRRGKLTTTTITESLECKAYRIDLKAMSIEPILQLDGRAIFIGLRSALSVSTSVFPSIKSDSIYVGGDDLMLGTSSEINGTYCLMDGTSELCGIFGHGGFDMECGHEVGPWGIDDYLSYYVTESNDD